MIISHKHKFIYLKSTKTASTSVEIALAEHVGEKDIVTPISDEGLEKGYVHPVRNNDGFSEHMLAQDIYTKLDKKIWESYTKIMCIRSPWDRLISQAYMKMARLGKHPKHTQEVVEFLSSYNLRAPFPLYCWSSLETNYDSCIDFIVKYETLKEDCEKLGKLLNLQLNLPFSKNHWRTNRTHYSKYFNDDLRLLINFLYQRDIYTFGYTYYDTKKEKNIPNSFELPQGTIGLRFLPRLDSDMIVLKNFADSFGVVPNYSKLVFEKVFAPEYLVRDLNEKHF